MAFPIERNFTNHPPANEEVVGQFERIREAVKHLAEVIDDECPESREKSLAFTNLEQTTFWSIASIARDGH